jgi:hypothetical protein
MTVRWLIVALLWLCACGNASRYHQIPGSTARISRPEVAENTELDLRILTTESECANLAPKEKADCLPWVDRASGEVHLAFAFYLGDDLFPMPISREELQITHLGSIIQEGQNKQNYEIIRHEPVRSPQLFVLLIDGSGSMNLPAASPGIERVKKALLQENVVDAFYPENVKTGVLLLQFVGNEVKATSGAPGVIADRKAYRQAVRSLQTGGGYTFLYDAIRQSTGDLLSDKGPAADFLKRADATVTIVALTDGFNNEAAADTCASNAPRLESLLKHLKNVRGKAVDLRTRPQVFTVGLGAPLFPRFELPKDLSRVDPQVLCRSRTAAPISGYLDVWGIDNASLSWIAEVGGGKSYVKRDAAGLGEAFQAAAAERYRWFEARYRLDPFYLRRSFRTRLRLLSMAEAESSVEIVPSAWLDGPAGVRAKDGWTRPAPLSRTVAGTMPFLGLIVSLTFLPAAFFNAWRALSGRLRQPSRKSGHTTSSGPAPTPNAPGRP